MKKKVLLTATVQSHICQFHKPLVQMLHDCGYQVHAAARNNLAEKNGLKLDFVDKVFDVPFSRSPKSADNIKAYKQLKKIIDSEGYEIIHCNTPMGGIVTRLAARKARKNGTVVIYTAHGFHFYKGAPKKNWIFFYPVEKLFSRLTDKLITITQEEVIEILKEISDLIQSTGAMSAIHCCGKCDWTVPVKAGVNIINLDAYGFAQNLSVFYKSISQFLNKGGKIAWGVVPTLDKIALEKADTVLVLSKFDAAVNYLTKKGIDEKLIIDNSIITPSCGAGALSKELAQKAMELTKNVSDSLKEKYKIDC